jgi:hypothetical protein
LRKIVVATNGLTGGSSIEVESIASNEDGGGDENVMDEEEDKDAEEVEVGVNPLNLPPIIPGKLYILSTALETTMMEGGSTLPVQRMMMMIP